MKDFYSCGSWGKKSVKAGRTEVISKSLPLIRYILIQLLKSMGIIAPLFPSNKTSSH